jgi:hypothetical protein
VALLFSGGALTYATPISQVFNQLVTSSLPHGAVSSLTVVSGCQPIAADYADATAEDAAADSAISAASDLYAYLNSQWALAGDGLETVAVDVSGSQPVLDVETIPSTDPSIWSWQQQLINSGLVPSTYEGFATEVTEVPVVNSF